MIVFRCVSEREIASMMGISSYINSPHGPNTFKYEKGINYKHFFFFYDSVIQFMNAQNTDRYYDKYVIILAYDIPEDMLNNCFGLGTYRFDCVPASNPDSLLNYFDIMYFPEFAIPENLIDKSMIVGIGSNTRITPISYVYYDEMESTITDNQMKFLNYQKWLIQNENDVSIESVQHYFNNIFALKDKPEIL